MTVNECATLRPGDVVYHSNRMDNLVVTCAGVIPPTEFDDNVARLHAYGVMARAAYYDDEPFVAWGDCLSLVKRAYPRHIVLPDGI